MSIKFICIVVFILFIINPTLAFLTSWIIMFKCKMSDKKVGYFLLIISIYWGMLAFTQKSHAFIETDCIRYYEIFGKFEQLNIIETIANFTPDYLLNYTFSTISAIIVSFTGNVQSISLLWVLVSYYCTYKSLNILLKYFGCYSQRIYVSIVFIITFGFMLFVQISELLKQASAFAVFFYGFSYYISNGSKLRTILLIVISIGIHPSLLMLLPLFLYKYVNTRFLLIVVLILTPLVMKFNIFEFAFNLLPNGQYFSLIIDKYQDNSGRQIATAHYIVIELILLIMSILLWKQSGSRKSNSTNIALLYFFVSFVNYGNLTAFLRFSLFSHWVFALLLIHSFSLPINRYRLFFKLLVVAMFFLSFRFTMGRLFTGRYQSSYMDNSSLRIISSTSFDYLNEKYYDKNTLYWK